VRGWREAAGVESRRISLVIKVVLPKHIPGAGEPREAWGSRLRPLLRGLAERIRRSPDPAILALIVVIGALLRFHLVGQKSVWVDEGVSIELARLGWYDFMRIVWRHEGNMLLYHLLLRVCLWFGSSEAYIRSLSVLFTLATLPAVYVLGKRLFDSRTGLVGAFLLSINAYHVRYAQEARSYALYPLLCVLSSIYFLEFLQAPTEDNRRSHVVSSALAVYAHFFAGLLLVAQWLSLRWPDQKANPLEAKKNWRQLSVAIAPIALFIVTTGTGVVSWIPRPGLSDLGYSWLFLSGNGGIYLAAIYGAACLAAIARGLAKQRTQRLGFEVWRYGFLLLWLVFPIVFVFLISQLKPFFLTRYFIFTLPALVLLAAAGLVNIPNRWFLAGTLLVMAIFAMRGVTSYYDHDFDISREDWRSATRYLLAHTRPGDAVLFHQPIGRMPYEYYRSVISGGAEPVVIYPAHGDNLTFRDFYAGRAPDSFLESVPGHYSRVWVVLTYNRVGSGPDPTTRFLTDLFARLYGVPQQRTFPGIELVLYTHKK
jgi:mannosyltransferase